MAAELIGKVDDNIVLHIRARADGDLVDIAAQGAVVSDTGLRIDCDVPDHVCACSNEGTGMDFRGIGFVGLNGHPDRKN